MASWDRLSVRKNFHTKKIFAHTRNCRAPRCRLLELRGPVGKSDEVRTNDSVITHLIWPIEELDIRSMSL